MAYSARIRLAAATAFLVHLVGLLLLPFFLHETPPGSVVEAVARPIVLSFDEPEAEPAKRLIESGAPAEQPIEDTDLISDQDAQAQDQIDTPTEGDQPDFDEVSEFDELTPPPNPTEPEEPEKIEEIVASPAEAPEEIIVAAVPEERTTEPEAEPEPVEEEPEPVAAMILEPKEFEAPIELPPIEDPSEAVEPEDAPERFQIAEAAAQPTVLPQEVRSSHGRESGGADTSGFTSFEANEHEMGEYMLKVRRRVERQWRAALQFRYTGARRTFALIECSIRPDGTLEFVRIVDQGPSLSYAILCIDAIKKAGPFPAFPFDVPDIYREDNLEITWKFSFL